MASEYFLEPEINLVTENTENILSEGDQGRGTGSKRILGERAGLGREGVGSYRGQRVVGEKKSNRNVLAGMGRYLQGETGGVDPRVWFG